TVQARREEISAFQKPLAEICAGFRRGIRSAIAVRHNVIVAPSVPVTAAATFINRKTVNRCFLGPTLAGRCSKRSVGSPFPMSNSVVGENYLKVGQYEIAFGIEVCDE